MEENVRTRICFGDHVYSIGGNEPVFLKALLLMQK